MGGVGIGISSVEASMQSSRDNETYTPKNMNRKTSYSFVSNIQKNEIEKNGMPKVKADETDKVYNCYTCNIQIYNHTFLRFHFKSEWHKYNLKRKLLNLGSVDELTFNRKVANLNKVQEERNEKKKGNVNGNGNGKGKGKKKEKDNFSTKKKEKKKEGNGNGNISKIFLNVEAEAENLKKYATSEKQLLEKNVPYNNPLICFFDNRIFSSIEENREHMKREYTFSLPDEKYVTSFKKIYLIIGKAIYEDNVCIYCFKHFRCVKAAQMHMLCNGHTKIDDRFGFLIEKYYDFTKTYVELINRYIQSKEDKEQILHLIDTIQQEKEEMEGNSQRRKNVLRQCEANLKRETQEEGSETNGEIVDVDVKKYIDDSQENTSMFDDEICDDEDEKYDDNTHEENPNECIDDSDDYALLLKEENASKQKIGGNVENTCNENSLLKSNSQTELSICEDFKLTEKELNKNVNSDVIYEALEHFGYNKPELNEYNNLILPDGSEAINRKYAYIFQQDFSITNRSNNEILLQVEKAERKNKTTDYKHLKYYVDYMKKFQLGISVKANKLNKFMKTESICFF